MQGINRQIIIKILLAVCVVTQSVMMFPHHHHDGSVVACINPFHCLDEAEESCGLHANGCCGHAAGSDHHLPLHHHDNEDSTCSFSHIDLVIPVKDSAQLDHVPVVDITCLLSSDPLFDHNTALGDDNGGTGKNTDHTVKIPVFVEYISRAIPARAPALFTV